MDTLAGETIIPRPIDKARVVDTSFSKNVSEEKTATNNFGTTDPEPSPVWMDTLPV